MWERKASIPDEEPSENQRKSSGFFGEKHPDPTLLQSLNLNRDSTLPTAFFANPVESLGTARCSLLVKSLGFGSHTCLYMEVLGLDTIQSKITPKSEASEPSRVSSIGQQLSSLQTIVFNRARFRCAVPLEVHDPSEWRSF